MFVIGVLVVLFLIGQEKEAPLAEKTKPCGRLFGTGEQTFKVMTDKPKTFRIVQVDVDPIDVKEGETQTITVKVKDDGSSAITKKNSIIANILTDNKSTATAAFVMRLAEDSEDGSSLFTTWEGFWTRNDTNCYTYMETITATNGKGDVISVDLPFK